MADKIVIKKGATFKQVIRWETDPIKYAVISGATQTAPCRITAVEHGIPNGWRIDKIIGVKGMTQLNTHQLSNGQYAQTGLGRRVAGKFKATVVDSDTIDLHQVNAQAFSAYESLGMIEYYTPVNLAGYEARMQIRSSVDSATVLLELNSTANTRIVLDNTAKTITLNISAIDTAALTFKSGVASLEMKDASGVVTFVIDNAPVTVLETDITRD